MKNKNKVKGINLEKSLIHFSLIYFTKTLTYLPNLTDCVVRFFHLTKEMRFKIQFAEFPPLM